MNEEDKKKEVKYPVGEERLTIGGFRNFQEFQIDKQIELIEDLIIKLNKKSDADKKEAEHFKTLLIKLNKKAEGDKKEAERFESLLAELCKEFISLQNFTRIKSLDQG